MIRLEPSGQVLGATAFADMAAAYDALPAEVRDELREATATHDFNKFWEMMRTRPGSERAPLTDEQRRRRPASVHPLFMSHPISGQKVLYCNPGYAVRINELDPDESQHVLESLFAHQLQPRFRYAHTWTPGRGVRSWPIASSREHSSRQRSHRRSSALSPTRRGPAPRARDRALAAPASH